MSTPMIVSINDRQLSVEGGDSTPFVVPWAAQAAWCRPSKWRGETTTKLTTTGCERAHDTALVGATATTPVTTPSRNSRTTRHGRVAGPGVRRGGRTSGSPTTVNAAQSEFVHRVRSPLASPTERVPHRETASHRGVERGRRSAQSLGHPLAIASPRPRGLRLRAGVTVSPCTPSPSTPPRPRCGTPRTRPDRRPGAAMPA